MKADKLLGLSNTLSQTESSPEINNSSVVFNLKQNHIMSSFDDNEPKGRLETDERKGVEGFTNKENDRIQELINMYEKKHIDSSNLEASLTEDTARYKSMYISYYNSKKNSCMHLDPKKKTNQFEKKFRMFKQKMKQKHPGIAKSHSEKDQQDKKNRRANVSILNTYDYDSSKNLECDEVKIEEEKAMTSNLPGHPGFFSFN